MARGRQRARFRSDCVMNPEGWGLGSFGTHVEGTQDVERGPNAQVVDGTQDERHDEGADAVALGEQGRDGEADEDPEEQRDERGAQHAWGPRSRDRVAHSHPPPPQTPRSLPLPGSLPCKVVTCPSPLHLEEVLLPPPAAATKLVSALHVCAHCLQRARVLAAPVIRCRTQRALLPMLHPVPSGPGWPQGPAHIRGGGMEGSGPSACPEVSSPVDAPST